MLCLEVRSRYLAMSPYYFAICREASEKVDFKLTPDIVVGKMSGAFATKDIESLKKLYNEMITQAKLSIQSFTFGAMCLEAFIYDYAAHNFSNTYVDKYLDKLDLIGKWVIIPQLVTGKKFPRECQAFEHLALLIRERNHLVHFKSVPKPEPLTLDIILERLVQQIKKDIELKKMGLNPYKIVIEVLTELRKLEGEGVEPKWWELKEEPPDSVGVI